MTRAALLMIVLLLLPGCGLAGFTEPRFVENDPLLLALHVRDVQADGTLVLWHGTTVAISDQVIDAEVVAQVRNAIDAGGGVVDIEPTGVARSDGAPVYVAHVRREFGYCGTPWAALVTIPIFTDELPMWSRETLVPGRDGR